MGHYSTCIIVFILISSRKYNQHVDIIKVIFLAFTVELVVSTTSHIIVYSFIGIPGSILQLVVIKCIHWLFSQLVQDGAEVSTSPSTIATDSTAVDNHDPTYMEARSEYLTYSSGTKYANF